MNIENDKVVLFHYSLKGDQGELIEESHGGEPTAYLHGKNNILPGLEAELVGKGVGDKIEVTLSPAQAYGEHNPQAVQRVPIKNLVGKGGKVRPGQILTVETDQGPRQVRVVKTGKFNADVDTNHPLAGKVLTFAIDIVSVREAGAEELENGHVHGHAEYKQDAEEKSCSCC